MGKDRRSKPRMQVPYGALVDAQRLNQYSSGNICFGDSYFAMHCREKWGEEVFNEACRRTEYIDYDGWARMNGRR